MADPDDLTGYVGRDKKTGESCYDVVAMTPYGEHLTYTYAHYLVPFSSQEGVLDNFKNRAIWAYLKE